MRWLLLSVAGCLAALLVVLRLAIVRNTTVAHVGSYRQIIRKRPPKPSGVVQPSSTTDTTEVLGKHRKRAKPDEEGQL